MKTNNWSSWIINSLLLFFFTFALYIIDDDRWYEWHVGKYGLKKIKMKSRNNVNLCMLLLFASWFLENNKQKISLFHINILSQKKARDLRVHTHKQYWFDLFYEGILLQRQRERESERETRRKKWQKLHSILLIVSNEYLLFLCCLHLAWYHCCAIVNI